VNDRHDLLRNVRLAAFAAMRPFGQAVGGARCGNRFVRHVYVLTLLALDGYTRRQQGTAQHQQRDDTDQRAPTIRCSFLSSFRFHIVLPKSKFGLP
jgi:hypothetical protein